MWSEGARAHDPVVIVREQEPDRLGIVDGRGRPLREVELHLPLKGVGAAVHQVVLPLR